MNEFNISDPYFIAYHIYSLALKDKNINDGLSKALYLIKICLDADSAILYEQNENGDYIHKNNSSLMSSNSSFISSILNSAQNLLEDNQKYELDINFGNLHHIVFIKINSDNHNYVLALAGNHKFNKLDNQLLNILIKSMKEVLNKLEQFNSIIETAEIDTLTGLSNRNMYENYVNNEQVTDKTIYAIFDLFRLKSINDNYSHQKGDEYIKKTADILKKHFPKYFYTIDSTGKKNKCFTGSCLYRVGGDEFVLISNRDSFESIQIKIMIIQEEVKKMDLNVSETLGINYGLVQGKNDETFRDLYLKADLLLSQNKSEYYKTTGYERRK